MEVAAAGDPRLADFTRLTDVALRQSREPAEGLFIAEGEPVLARALAAGYRPRAVLCDARYAQRCVELLDNFAAEPDVPVYSGSADLLSDVTGFHVHRGVLGSLGRRPVPSVAALLARCRRVIAVEDSNNPTNLGAIFRSAAGLGIDGLLLSPSCADPLYRRCVRVSMGGVFAVPYARCADWPGDLDAPGFRVLALTPGPAARPIGEAARAGPGRVILLLGAEGPGLSAAALAAADELVRIPMAPGTDSLNLAAAAAIGAYLFGGEGATR